MSRSFDHAIPIGIITNNLSDNYDKYEWCWPMSWSLVDVTITQYWLATVSDFARDIYMLRPNFAISVFRLDTYFAAWIKKWLQVLQNCLPLLVPMFVLPWQIHQSPLAADVSFHSLSKLNRSFIVLWKWEKKSKDLAGCLHPCKLQRCFCNE